MNLHILMSLRCSSLQYSPLSSLPKAGVVLIFHNELWSVLLRTVFSILDAGPEELVTEVVLVDDASDKGEGEGLYVSVSLKGAQLVDEK